MCSARTIQEVLSILSAMRRAQEIAGPADLDLRESRLKRIGLLIANHQAALVRAVESDCAGKHLAPPPDTLILDLSAGLNMRLIRAADNAQQPPDIAGIVMGWRSPIACAFTHLAVVFAAGHVAMMKVSDRTPAIGAWLSDHFASHFSPGELCLVMGGAALEAAFAAMPFDAVIMAEDLAPSLEPSHPTQSLFGENT